MRALILLGRIVVSSLIAGFMSDRFSNFYYRASADANVDTESFLYGAVFCGAFALCMFITRSWSKRKHFQATVHLKPEIPISPRTATRESTFLEAKVLGAVDDADVANLRDRIDAKIRANQSQQSTLLSIDPSVIEGGAPSLCLMDRDGLLGVWATVWNEGTRVRIELNYVERAKAGGRWIEDKMMSNWNFESSWGEASRRFIWESRHINGERADAAQMIRQSFMVSLQNAVQEWEGQAIAGSGVRSSEKQQGRRRRD